ncbi:MAG: glycosyltransferase [Armatimonadetes bacterium]|nr:glycosyltransferase [Armatimonadota bacterium]
MKVAIVHDYLNQMGGAEKVVEVFHDMFPSSPIFTSVYIPEAVSERFREADIRTSFVQNLPLVRKLARHYLASYPYAFELFDFSGYDVVLSSSSAFAKGIITGPDTCHICYCHTPMRFAWDYHAYIERERFSAPVRFVLPYVVHRVRRWDEITANRVDHYIANSHEVERRIRKYYRRNARVISPPAETHRFRVTEQDDGYFVIISRLLAYKRLDIAIEAANMLHVPLKIVGTGRDEKRLKSLAGPTVEFVGRLVDGELVDCLQRSRALIFPGREDFGIVPVEAMACGKPVIAYGRGGALDTVIDGVTGVLFDDQTPDSLAEAIRLFRPDDFDPYTIRRHAEAFDVSVFHRKMMDFIEEMHDQHRTSYGAIEPARLEEGLARV